MSEDTRKLKLIQYILATEEHTALEAIEEAMQTYEARGDKYWSVIDKLDWSQEGNDEAVLAPAVEALAKEEEPFVLAFYDWLSERLYQLDRADFAAHSVDDDEHFSADLFLYARCAVVANGRSYYELVMAQPDQFPKALYFERLLELPARAYERKTGRSLPRAPKRIYETGFNLEGWGEQGIRL